jgi:hypothetical protein
MVFFSMGPASGGGVARKLSDAIADASKRDMGLPPANAKAELDASAPARHLVLRSEGDRAEPPKFVSAPPTTVDSGAAAPIGSGRRVAGLQRK